MQIDSGVRVIMHLNRSISRLVQAAHRAPDLGKLCIMLEDLRVLAAKHGLPPDPPEYGLDTLPTFGPDTEPSLRTQGAISWDRYMMLVRVGGYWTLMMRPDYQARKFTMH